jgi:hypothetical protein
MCRERVHGNHRFVESELWLRNFGDARHALNFRLEEVLFVIVHC